MKTRVIVSLILLPLLLMVVLALPKIVTAILFGVMAAIAAPFRVYYAIPKAFPRACFFGI